MATSQQHIESALFRSYWDDGLLDLLSGVGLLAIGIGWTTNMVVLAAVMPAVLTVFWRPLRARVVEPHGGFVRFSRSRQHRTTRGLWLTTALGTVTFVLGIALYVITRQRGATPIVVLLVPGLPAALIAILAFLAGLLTGARRFHGYGLTLMAAALVTILLHVEPGPPLAAVGLLVVATGTILLIQFLKASRAYQERS